MIQRTRELNSLKRLLGWNKVVAIIGARQSGKTTLALSLARQWKGPVTRFDLEDLRDRSRMEDPYLALDHLKGLIIIDEIQHAPRLFEALRVLADRPRFGARFLVLGSASPELLRQGSESLAGRIAFLEIAGFSLDDVGAETSNTLWLRGGFPRAFLARTPDRSFSWRQDYVRTFLERDLSQIGVNVSAETMRRFWMMLAHWHGQVWNSSEFARSFGVQDTTVRGYLDKLCAALAVRLLQPWHENVSKRQVKAPKVQLADTGILHALLNLRSLTDVEGHPKCGASWASFAMDEVIRTLGVRRLECFFWATYAGAELDLLVVRGRLRLGFEFKRTLSPTVTPSMRIALKDLGLKQIDVIYPGDEVFPMAEKIRAVPLKKLRSEVKRLEAGAR